MRAEEIRKLVQLELYHPRRRYIWKRVLIEEVAEPLENIRVNVGKVEVATGLSHDVGFHTSERNILLQL
jgi:hypothetical protein